MIAMAASQNGMLSDRYFYATKTVEDLIEENRAKGKIPTYQPKPLKKHQQLGVRKTSRKKRKSCEK